MQHGIGMAKVMMEREIKGSVRGYHFYRNIWNSTVEKTRVEEAEPSNMVDRNGISVVKDSVIIHHLVKEVAKVSLSHHVKCQFWCVTCTSKFVGILYVCTPK